MFVFFFFFQAEDGIRDADVTGVQTCALPISGEAVEADDLGADGLDVLLGYRRELAPERVELVAVEPSRARLEARRVDEVRGADLRDVHPQPRMLADERACRARVVEMDMREQQVSELVELEAAPGQLLLQRAEAGGGAAVEERGAVRGLEQVRADDALAAEMKEVDRVVLRHDPILCSVYAGAATRARRRAKAETASSSSAPATAASHVGSGVQSVPPPSRGTVAGSPARTSVCLSTSPPRYQPPRERESKIAWPGFRYVTAPPLA